MALIVFIIIIIIIIIIIPSHTWNVLLRYVSY